MTVSSDISVLLANYRPLLEQLRTKISAEQYERLEKIAACSPFVADHWQRKPHWCEDFFSQDCTSETFRISSLLIADNASESDFIYAIRDWRQQQLTRLAARAILQIDTVRETCSYLSAVADFAIQQALFFANKQVKVMPKFQTLQQEEAPEIIILGMGKLGGDELNFSSDIDLIFLYDSDHIQGDQHSWLPFITAVVQRVIKYLGANTDNGFVFRVDTRLRPFGDSGAIALSLSAAEEYYSQHGRDWERYALIKARAITGSHKAVSKLNAILMPFVYRKYLDFGAINALRDLKKRIIASYGEQKLQAHLKLGQGGIREVEFIVQMLQLIHGGKKQTLQTPSLVTAAKQIQENQFLQTEAIDSLLDAYWYLRQAENTLQMMRDQQVHHLPIAEADQTRLALAMQVPDYASFLQILTQKQTLVSQLFHHLLFDQDIDANKLEKQTALSTPHQVEIAKQIWQTLQTNPTASIEDELQKLGFVNTDSLHEPLMTLVTFPNKKVMSAVAQQRLTDFIAHVLVLLPRSVAYIENEKSFWQRLVFFIKQVVLRSAYLVMLTENIAALQTFILLLIKSSWLADMVSTHPMMLDDLFAQENKVFSNKVIFAQRLANVLQHKTELEQQMETLREFKHEQTMRIAVADIRSALPLMQVSDALTNLSEVLLDQALLLPKQSLHEVFGEPCFIDEHGQTQTADLAVIAYGKMGGFELSYESDLDIVFLHNSHGKQEYTNGKRSIDNTTYFARWVQKTLHILNTRMHQGRLYEIDLRLRPNGAAGTLATRLTGYADYLKKEAWLWELQALVRARFVAGNAVLGARFTQLRQDILCLPRNADEVKAEVVNMRQKMRNELATKHNRNKDLSTFISVKTQKPDRFDIKQDLGGIADIEFMVQYAVLAHAAKTPELAHYTDNIRLLELLAANDYLTQTDSRVLIGAYQLYRQVVHHRSLQQQGRVISDMDDEVLDAVDAVSHLWFKTMQQ